MTNASPARNRPEPRIREILQALIRQRQAMRRTATDRRLLEANRLGIVYWQSRLASGATQHRARDDAA
jgi:hypothetical protein